MLITTKQEGGNRQDKQGGVSRYKGIATIVREDVMVPDSIKQKFNLESKGVKQSKN